MKVSLICLNMCECVCVQGWRYEKNRDMIEIATCGWRRVRYFLGSKICGQLGSLPIHNFLCTLAKIRNYPRLYNGVENLGSYKALAPYFSFLQQCMRCISDLASPASLFDILKNLKKKLKRRFSHLGCLTVTLIYFLCLLCKGDGEVL